MKHKLFIKIILLSVLLLSIFIIFRYKLTPNNKTTEDLLSSGLKGFMSVDTYINNNIKFISLDLSNVDNIDEATKTKLRLNVEETFNTEVNFNNLNSLELNGLYDPDKKYLNGILITLTDIETSDSNNFIIKGTKYRHGDSSTKIECTIRYVNGSYKVMRTTIIP